MKNLKNHCLFMCSMLLIAILLGSAQEAFGLFERRRDQFEKDFAYFVYPIGGRIPGLGSAAGGGATVVNMFGTDADFTGFALRGDFDASGATLLNIHLLPKFFIFDIGYYTARVAPKVFERGIESSADKYMFPHVNGSYTIGQLTFTFLNRRIELYHRLNVGTYFLDKIYDKEGNIYFNANNEKIPTKKSTSGLSLDFTDDKQDPRSGLRFESTMDIQEQSDLLLSQFKVLNNNVTTYLPLGAANTLVFNGFTSKSVVDRQATVDESELRSKIGLGCSAIPDPQAQAQCQATEDRVVAERIANNTYGQATALGGTQRLRSYSNGRFYAGNSLFYGGEFRWNLTNERSPFDIGLMKGIRTSLQVAFFTEQGTVAEKFEDLVNSPKKISNGVGFRVVFSGITVRSDIAFGNEGTEMQLFIDYPWGLFSVDGG